MIGDDGDDDGERWAMMDEGRSSAAHESMGQRRDMDEQWQMGRCGMLDGVMAMTCHVYSNGSPPRLAGGMRVLQTRAGAALRLGAPGVGPARQRHVTPFA